VRTSVEPRVERLQNCDRRLTAVDTQECPANRGAHMKTTLREVFHLTFPGLLLVVLSACGGGSNDQSAVPAMSTLQAPPAGLM
jgi:hypothetical protein